MTLEVHGRTKKDACRHEAPERLVSRGFAKETTQALVAFGTHTCLPVNPKASRKPVPERHKKLRTPAPQTPPALRIDHDTKVTADFTLAEAVEEIQLESFEDGAATVPPLRVQMVTEDADRMCATPA